MGWQDSPIVGAPGGNPPLAVPSSPPPAPGAAPATGWQSSPIVADASPSSAPAKPGGIVRNIAAGGDEAAADILGAPVDAMTWLLNKGYDLASESGQPLITNPPGGSQSIERAMGWIGANPQNVGTNTLGEAVARSVGGGAVNMAVPYVGGRALIARGLGVGESLGDELIRMLGGPAPAEAGAARTAAGAAANAAIGGTAAAGGQGAAALLPDSSPYRPLANTAGQLLAGGALGLGMAGAKAGINAGANAARDLVAPMRPASLETLVANRLRAAATNPSDVAYGLGERNPELIPGSMPTTFQATGDQGLGQLEASLRRQFPDAFAERDAAQRTAQAGALAGLAPAEAKPGAVRDLLRGRLDQIDAEGDAAVTAARQKAAQEYAAAGGTGNPEDRGAAMRAQLEGAKAGAKAQESALWQAIDPQGNLAINGAPVARAANQIISEIPATAKPPQGEEKAVFDLAASLGTQAPFRDFAALRSRLLQAIRDEREAGQTPALRRMQMLRGAMDDAISNAAENVAQEQAQEVAAGMRSQAQTIEGKLLDQTRQWYAARSGDGGLASPSFDLSAQGFVGDAGRGPDTLPGALGTEGQGGGGFLRGTPVQGVPAPPQPLAPFDAEAAARYRAAADATRARAQTFNNPVTGPALQERGGAYRIAASQLPERFIATPEGVQSFLAAGGDPATLRDALVADLRRTATNPDGTLAPTRFASWKLRRGAALRAFPDLQATLGNAAEAQGAVDQVAAQARQARLDFERGAARHFLNSEPMQAVQSALNSRTPVADFGDLTRMVAGNPDAKAGLQRAVADYIAQRFITTPSAGGAAVKDSITAFLARHRQALGTVFSPDQMAGMQKLAADMQRSAMPLPKGAAPRGGHLSLLSGYLGHGIAGLAGYLLGGVHGALESAGVYAMGKDALDALRRTGINHVDQLLAEAALNPELARTLLMKASPGNRPFIAARLKSVLGTLGAVAGASAVGGGQQSAPPPYMLPAGAPALRRALP